MSVEPSQLRQVMGEFATGATVVTFPSDPLHGLTVNALSSLSLDPPLVLICIDHGTTTYDLLTRDTIDGYCVNILDEDQRDLGEHFAGMTDLGENPFETERTRTEVSGAPIFEDSLAYLDCSLRSAYDEGDHTIYVGAVESTHVLQPDGAPLAFYQGNWGTVRSNA